MPLPFFFTELNAPAGQEIILDEENSRHIIQVLRMKQGERLLLTDGKGHSMEAEITEAHKKHCTVNVLTIEFTPRQDIHLVIAISLIKNTSRFEWFLEKATELGTAEIIPVICERTEKQRARYDRFINICRSAMLQSSQNWLPVVHPPTDYSKIVEHASEQQKFIAHCHPEHKQSLSGLFDSSKESHIVLIGPEGDFTDREITLATAHHFESVSLGNTRLRTETAGIYAAAICRR